MLRLNRLSRINIVTTTKQGRTPGRPRQFDAEQAIETAQRLFHARGYDAVSVADSTRAFGINPRAFMPLLAVSSGCIPASCSATARPGPFPSMPCCETTSRWRRRSSPYCRRRLAAMWPIRPPPAAGAGGYIVRMLMPGWRQANGMLRQEPKSSSISPAIARRTRCG